ncbi:hypothetical protein PGT21_030053 [Puccinia graminis f. sp. tritici]|uniref:Uncharacterized protein n=1 Tax=Puccinia graminis f. sp. tritici TaxID=56615 RepID=A0A5B0MM74_PUCGR|nr:hypothetical protein PGT21_030053 [Puccinia graminis f. sp. tritici]KAA1113941.1 hypothetical protein PGTUg99_020625 [Puccinia graminis f. sp. tritici]
MSADLSPFQIFQLLKSALGLKGAQQKILMYQVETCMLREKLLMVPRLFSSEKSNALISAEV